MATGYTGANYNWKEWGTSPEKAYYNYANAKATGNVGVQNGYERPKDAINADGGSESIARPTLPTIDPYTPTATYKAPEYVAPSEYVAPEYTAPTYDEGKVESLTQRKSAAGLRAARQALQQSTGGYYENPNVKRMTLRDALAGYGMAVENVVGGAGTEARSQYNTEFGIAADASKTNFNKEIEEGKLNYNTALDTAKTKYAGETSETEKNYQSMQEAGKLNWQTNYNSKMAEYQAQLQDYMARMYGTGATKYGAYSSGNDTDSNSTTPTGTRVAGGTIPSGSSGKVNSQGQYLDYKGNPISQEDTTVRVRQLDGSGTGY